MKSEFLSDVLEQISDGFIAIDHNELCVYANKKALALLNFDQPGVIIGKQVETVFSQIPEHPIYVASKQALETQVGVEEDVYFELWKTWYQLRIYPYDDGIKVYFNEISERKRVDTTLKEKSEQLILALRAASVGLWDWDLQTDKVYFSPEWKHQIGYQDHEIANEFHEWESRVHPADLESAMKTVEGFLAEPYPNYHNEFRFRHKDGTYRWILAQADLLFDDNDKPIRMIGSHIDVTNRKQNEIQIAKSGRAHKVISKINRAIIQNQEMETLFDIACKIAVEDGNFQMAWIGILDAETGRIKPVASAGVEEGYLEKLQITLDDHNRGQGPTGQSLIEGQSVVCNDIANDPRMLPWRDAALKRGYRSSVAFPLNISGGVRGSISLYSAEVGFFDHEELELLSELAEDISFSMRYAETAQQHKRTQEALESSEVRFRTLIEKSSNLLLLIDRDAQITYASPAIEPLLGYTAEEFLQLDRFNIVHPDDLDSLMDQIKWSMEHPGEVIEGEHRVRHKDGSWRAFRRVLRNLLHDPAINALVSNLSDITERKQAEEELRISERLFFDAFHVGPAGMTITRIADGKFIDANESFCQMFEYEREEVIGYTSIELNMWTSEQRQKLIRQQLQVGGLHNFELVAQSKTAKDIYLLFSSREIQIRDEACHLTTLIDISERKKVEDALRESEEKYRMLVEDASDGIFVSDSQGYYVDVNTSGCLMLGYAREELLGMHLRDLVTEGDLADQPLRTKELRAGKPLITVRLLKHKNGTAIPVEISGTKLPNGQLVGIVRDITERNRAEQARRESEERYRFLFENIMNGFAFCEMYFEQGIPRDFIYLEVNNAFEIQTGLSNVIGKRVSEIIPGIQESDPELFEAYGRVALTGVPESFEIYVDAMQMWFSISVYSPQKFFFVAVFDVITERKRAEEALRAKEERFRLAMENIPDVVVIYDPNLTIQFINNATTMLTGRAVDDFIGQRDDEIWPPEVYERYIPILEEALRTKDTVSIETEIMVSNSLSQYVIITCVPILDSKNDVREILGITHNLTERKQAEQALHRYNQRLNTLRQIDKDIIGARLGNDVVNAVFHSLSELIPYDRATVILIDHETKEMITYSTQTKTKSPLMEGQRHPMTHLQLANAMDKGQAVIIPDLRDLPDSTSDLIQQLIREEQRASISIPMLVQGVRIGSLNLSSKIPAFFTLEHEEILQEIANQLAIAIQQSRLYEQIEQMNQELEQRVAERTSQLESKNRELETFTYTVSHDLKAPLRGIDGYSRLLLEDYRDELDEQGQVYLRNVRIATDQMNQLIEDLLAYSRLERWSLQSTSVNLRQLAESMIVERSRDIEEKSVDVSVTIADTLASIDLDGFSMALRNLLDNALKFTRRGQSPVIEIGGYENDDSYVLWVKDNGIGFDMKYHDRILQIFQRLHRAEDYVGTGIGLAIAQKAMERMGGRIWAESEPDAGSIFYLEVPK